MSLVLLYKFSSSKWLYINRVQVFVPIRNQTPHLFETDQFELIYHQIFLKSKRFTRFMKKITKELVCEIICIFSALCISIVALNNVVLDLNVVQRCCNFAI